MVHDSTYHKCETLEKECRKDVLLPPSETKRV